MDDCDIRLTYTSGVTNRPVHAFNLTEYIVHANKQEFKTTHAIYSRNSLDKNDEFIDIIVKINKPNELLNVKELQTALLKIDLSRKMKYFNYSKNNFYKEEEGDAVDAQTDKQSAAHSSNDNEGLVSNSGVAYDNKDA
eukprot:CAMPEP_0116947944 /NCGR_PEP_ID=MMETSP0467-20121206/37992_1 /TAXON_ID=283647 /ORGANISM="Mesodinium pulex, Strain SPMC105" /LENGTH=137 /DNA_ID=CAMNT_0004632229 /DNA_START=327 /DNA_END=740 /DNA_ORIENTATION=+